MLLGGVRSGFRRKKVCGCWFGRSGTMSVQFVSQVEFSVWNASLFVFIFEISDVWPSVGPAWRGANALEKQHNICKILYMDFVQVERQGQRVD